MGPVVQTLDSALHWINHYPADKHLCSKINRVIQWIVIYPADSAIHRSNNWGQMILLVNWGSAEE